MTMGTRYKQVMEKLLQKGKDRTTDLMEKKNLEGFQSALGMLKELVRAYSRYKTMRIVGMGFDIELFGGKWWLFFSEFRISASDMISSLRKGAIISYW
jgi:hypothetical protein